MTHTYQFHITGMTCHACESLITMDLEDAGMPVKTFDREKGLLTIELSDEQVTTAQEIIQRINNGQYTVVETKTL